MDEGGGGAAEEEPLLLQIPLQVQQNSPLFSASCAAIRRR
jgi:hypothetical protein